MMNRQMQQREKKRDGERERFRVYCGFESELIHIFFFNRNDLNISLQRV